MRDALGLFKGLQRFFARRFLASELEGNFANVDALFEEARDGGGEVHANVREKLLGISLEVFVYADGKCCSGISLPRPDNGLYLIIGAFLVLLLPLIPLKSLISAAYVRGLKREDTHAT